MKEITPYFLFLKTIKVHQKKMHSYLEKINMYPGQPYVLLTLYHGGEMSQSEIADKIRIRPATLTVMLKKLESEDLIARKKDEKDSRINKVHLTEKGEELIKELNKIHSEVEDICFDGLTNEEIDEFNNTLRKIKSNILKSMT